MNEQKTSNQVFWDKRTKKYGHTGWANQVIYAYDQLARLKAIDRIIDDMGFDEKKMALDFGAGSGDFTALLSNKFKKVIGYDISPEVIGIAKKKHSHLKNIDFIAENQISEMGIKDNSIDLILTITVLGHIIDSDELIKTLAFFHKKVKNNGYIIALEYCKTKELEENGYQKFLTFKEWKKKFNSSGFSLERDYGFFNPSANKISSYENYLSDKWIKLYNSFKGYLFLKKTFFWLSYLNRIAEKSVNKTDDFYWKGSDIDNLKIMILKKY